MIIASVALLMAFLAAPGPGMAEPSEKTTKLENSQLEAIFHPDTGLISVRDKRNGVWWNQADSTGARPNVRAALWAAAPGAMPTADWSGATPIAIGSEAVFNQGPSAAPVHGAVRLARDSHTIYAWAEVADSHVALSPAGAASYWESDSIEFWFGNEQLTLVLAEPPAGQEAPAVAAYWHGNPPDKQPIKADAVLTGGGYTIQFAMPLANIQALDGVEDAPCAIPFAVGINNADTPGKRLGQEYYPRGWNFGDASTFAELWLPGVDGALPTHGPLPYTQALESIEPATNTFVLNTQLPGIQRDGKLAPAAFKLVVQLDAERPELHVRFEPELEGEWREVNYPYVFTLDGEQAYVLLPHSEGLLAPVRRSSPKFLELPKDYIYNGYGAFCACLGLVDMAQGHGMLMIYDDPELAGYEMADARADGAIIAPRAYWRASKFRFDAPRRLTFAFSDQGGYVALAKAYRRHHQEAVPVKTLEEKRGANPNIDKLVGAPVFWVFESPEEVRNVAAMMKEDGFERVLFEVGYPYHSTLPGHEKQAEELAQAVQIVREMGYIISRYDQYRDTYEKDETASIYHQINTEAYPESVVVTETGELRHGWPPGYVINPVKGLELARQHIPQDLSRYAYNARFLDCVGTCALWESEDWSPQHTLDTYSGMQARRELLQYAQSLGLACGTEGSMDCFLPWLDWLESPMSLVKWTSKSLGVPGWTPPDTLDPGYQVSIGTEYRIPFYSLVHHDEVMSTWRWEDGFIRLPQYWQDKNLWSMLYGNPAMYFLNEQAYRHWRAGIPHTRQYLDWWTRKVGYAELVSHRFVSPDWKVQESVFSTGDGVVVNFSTQDYPMADGEVIPARSYRTFQNNTPRQYSPPPVPEMDYPASAVSEGNG